jgi:tetratricopeptide (TPR) repeat protein
VKRGRAIALLAPVRRALALALVACALCAGAARVARADRRDEAWRRGNEAYLHGDYAAAIAAYQELDLQGVVSADLYFNLGDAYYRQGNLGRAIWSFERAVALDPDDDDARYNLVQARKAADRRAHDKIEGADHDPLWMRVVTWLSPATETWLFVAVYLTFFAALAARLLRGRRASEHARALLGAAAAILGVVALLSGALLAGRARLDRLPFGVVLPDAVAVKEGADTNYRTSFELHAGLRVRLLERDQDWLRIRLPNGLEGWVREQDIGRL